MEGNTILRRDVLASIVISMIVSYARVFQKNSRYCRSKVHIRMLRIVAFSFGRSKTWRNSNRRFSIASRIILTLLSKTTHNRTKRHGWVVHSFSHSSRLRRQLGVTRQNPYEVHRDRARIAQRAIGRHERVLPERAIARWRRRIAREGNSRSAEPVSPSGR